MIKDQQQDQFKYSLEYFEIDGVNDYSKHLKEDKKKLAVRVCHKCENLFTMATVVWLFPSVCHQMEF